MALTSFRSLGLRSIAMDRDSGKCSERKKNYFLEYGAPKFVQSCSAKQ